jgi:hypothetical protein
MAGPLEELAIWFTVMAGCIAYLASSFRRLAGVSSTLELRTLTFIRDLGMP